jgi:hypothetical protein
VNHLCHQKSRQHQSKVRGPAPQHNPSEATTLRLPYAAISLRQPVRQDCLGLSPEWLGRTCMLEVTIVYSSPSSKLSLTCA